MSRRLKSIAQILGITVADLRDKTPTTKKYEQTNELNQLWDLLDSGLERDMVLELIRHLVQERE